MSRELYVSPVVEGREPPPEWVAVWRFRVTLLLILAAGIAIVAVIYHYASGAGDQGGNLTRALPAASGTPAGSGGGQLDPRLGTALGTAG